MGRIKGYYEWDDDELSPGQKKEGGLHQNLFDSEGKLKGSARFVPDDGDEAPLVITDTVYLPSEERLSDDDFELRLALVVRLIEIGVEGLPVAVQWWKSTGRPAVTDAKNTARRLRLSALKRRKKTKPVRDVAVVPGHEVSEASAANRPKMSSAEAKARYLAALAARAYSEEQMGLVMNADIVDMQGMLELEESIKRLPRDQVRGVLEQMIENPGMLSDDSLADLASLLGRYSHLGPAEPKNADPAKPTHPAPRSLDGPTC